MSFTKVYRFRCMMSQRNAVIIEFPKNACPIDVCASSFHSSVTISRHCAQLQKICCNGIRIWIRFKIPLVSEYFVKGNIGIGIKTAIFEISLIVALLIRRVQRRGTAIAPPAVCLGGLNDGLCRRERKIVGLHRISRCHPRPQIISGIVWVCANHKQMAPARVDRVRKSHAQRRIGRKDLLVATRRLTRFFFRFAFYVSILVHDFLSGGASTSLPEMPRQTKEGKQETRRLLCSRG
mmetsp:Transcript_60487/g.123415  ORF Transcript_60487/g.123415 Transcript_60487/m.123415 type:complete len:236 (-) Transcript_60487:183-890(-)